MPPKESIIGRIFGKLTVISDAPRRFRQAYSFCLCECGRQTVVNNTHLKKGRTKGCLQCRPKKHGMANTTTYQSWVSMKVRCCDVDCAQYADYGGRGITVCERWLKSFSNFLADMGERPLGLTLDRIDNEKGYYKENCRWATRLQQANNARSNRIETVRGVTDTIANLCRHFGVDHRLVRSRLQWNSDIEAAIFTPKLGK